MMSKILNCEEVIKQLYDYLDGELNDDLETDIESHIQSCQECMGRTEFERQLKNSIKETGDSEVPSTLNKRLMSIIDDLKTE